MKKRKKNGELVGGRIWSSRPTERAALSGKHKHTHTHTHKYDNRELT